MNLKIMLQNKIASYKIVQLLVYPKELRTLLKNKCDLKYEKNNINNLINN